MEKFAKWWCHTLELCSEHFSSHVVCSKCSSKDNIYCNSIEIIVQTHCIFLTWSAYTQLEMYWNHLLNENAPFVNFNFWCLLKQLDCSLLVHNSYFDNLCYKPVTWSADFVVCFSWWTAFIEIKHVFHCFKQISSSPGEGAKELGVTSKQLMHVCIEILGVAVANHCIDRV